MHIIIDNRKRNESYIVNDARKSIALCDVDNARSFYVLRHRNDAKSRMRQYAIVIARNTQIAMQMLRTHIDNNSNEMVVRQTRNCIVTRTRIASRDTRARVREYKYELGA